jgi:hypothetical protein
VLVVDASAARLSRKLGRLVVRQGLEADADLVQRAHAPGRTIVEQFRPRGDQDEDAPRRVTASGRDAFDQIEHLRTQRVRVFEEQGDRTLLREPLDQRHETGPHIVDEGRLVAPRLGEAEQRLEPIDGATVGAGDADPVDQLAQTFGRNLAGVVVADAGDLAHDRGRRRERGAVGPQVAPSDEDGALGIQT